MVAQSRRETEEAELAAEEAALKAASEEAEEEAVGAEVGEERKVLARLKCKACETVIPIYTDKRPLEIVCPECGKHGILK